MRDEQTMMSSHNDEKERAMRNEKEELIAGHKKKCDLMAQNHASEMERVRQLHKKVSV